MIAVFHSQLMDVTSSMIDNLYWVVGKIIGLAYVGLARLTTLAGPDWCFIGNGMIVA